jgi:hypothetical protein
LAETLYVITAVPAAAMHCARFALTASRKLR